MSYITTTKNEKNNHISSSSRLEEKLYLKLENSKGVLIKLYNICMPYWSAILQTFDTFWQYPEFRLGVYIFGLISIIPSALFLMFLLLVVFSTTILVSFVWTFFVFSALAIGLMVLVPILIGFSIIVGLLVVGYDIYQYLIRLKQANNQNNNTNNTAKLNK